MYETIGCAIIDSGCSSSVCGEFWLRTYLDTLSCKDKDSVKYNSSHRYYRFGDGKKLKALKSIEIPLFIGSKRTSIIVDVVRADIPLLFSRSSLNKAKAVIDFNNNLINMFGQDIPLLDTDSGHCMVSLKRPLDYNESSVRRIMQATTFTSDDVTDNKRKILKVHKQFAHPSASRLKDLLRNSGVKEKKLLNLVDVITDNCDTCKKDKRCPARPVVGMPLANEFNQVVAMDLKVFAHDVYFLHLIDHATRYSQAVVIRNKRKETIVQGIITNWVQLFGSAGKFLFDNGGEFVNAELIDFAEKFNIKLRATGAESPWSNGVCERHNALISSNVRKILFETSCSIETALGWALSAKNSLMNVSGFSPNQLVFGKNPNFPCILENKAPANSAISYSKVVEENLKALRLARENHIKAEADEKLRRALNKQTRTYSDQVFCSGDQVYFKRAGSRGWGGPATVLGKDGQTYLLKHGGYYIRVHPCRIQLTGLVDNAPLCDTGKIEKNVESNAVDDADVAPVCTSPNEPHLETLEVDDSSDSDSSSLTHVENGPTFHGPVSSAKTLPKLNSLVRYKTQQCDEWKNVKIISRGGKVNGRHWHFLNVKPLDGNQQEVEHVSFRDEVTQWHNIEETAPSTNEDVAINNNDNSLVVSNVYIGTHTSNSKFDQAKLEELKKWKDMKTYEEVDFSNQKLITTSWVCTEKVKGGSLICKARLVARGFEEDSKNFHKDSPTCSKDCLRLMLIISSTYKWPVKSIDIRSAFLQGMRLQRNVFLKPPVEANTDGKIWKLNYAVYGLSDASRHWYERVKFELVNLKVTVSRFDSALFYYEVDRCIHGILVVHVDDFLYAGTKLFWNNVILKLYSVFIVGSEDFGCMKFLGFDLDQNRLGISLGLKDYIETMKPISLSSDKFSSKQSPLTKSQYVDFRHLLGQINWCASQIRLDVAFDNCYLSNRSAEPCVNDLLYANKVVKKLKSVDLILNFVPFDSMDDLCILCYGDASFANLPSGSSQGGVVILLVDKNGCGNLLSWQSKKLKRVCSSTLCAEALAAIEAVNYGFLFKEILSEVCKSSNVKIRVLTDNKALSQTVSLLTVVEDKRLRIDIAALRETIQNQFIEGVFWIPSQYNVANPLTKQGAGNNYLIDVLSHKLKFDFKNNIFV